MESWNTDVFSPAASYYIRKFFDETVGPPPTPTPTPSPTPEPKEWNFYLTVECPDGTTAPTLTAHRPLIIRQMRDNRLDFTRDKLESWNPRGTAVHSTRDDVAEFYLLFEDVNLHYDPLKGDSPDPGLRYEINRVFNYPPGTTIRWHRDDLPSGTYEIRYDINYGYEEIYGCNIWSH